MPQQPGGGGGDPSLVDDILAAMRARGFNVSRAWVVGHMEDGWTVNDFYGWMNRNEGSSGGGDGTTGDIPTFGGSGDGGSGGGSSGSGASGPDPAQLRAAYIGMLRSWGISPNQVEGLLNQAVNNEWTSSQFQNHLRMTKVYKEAFHGIGSQDGMSEASYLAQFRQFKAKAQDAGLNLNRHQFGTLLKKGVDYQEFSYRVKADELIEKNYGLFQWYERELRRRGEIGKNQQLKRKNLWDIVTRQNSRRFEQIFQTAWLQQGLQKAGFDLFAGKKGGKGSDITRKDIIGLIKQFEGGTMGAEIENLKASDFASLADEVSKTIPASQLYGYGVTKRDMLELKLGGRRAPEIANKVQRAMDQAKAESEDKAGAQLVQTEKGTRLLTGGLSSE